MTLYTIVEFIALLYYDLCKVNYYDSKDNI